MQVLEDHILNEDFPEKIETYLQWGEDLGFSSTNILYQDPNTLFAFLEFRG